MMEKKTRLSDHIWVILLSILAVAYLYPIFMILINSLKEERAIGTSDIFNFPTSETFAGFTNYIIRIDASIHNTTIRCLCESEMLISLQM